MFVHVWARDGAGAVLAHKNSFSEQIHQSTLESPTHHFKPFALLRLAPSTVLTMRRQLAILFTPLTPPPSKSRKPQVVSFCQTDPRPTRMLTYDATIILSTRLLPASYTPFNVA